MIGAVIGQLVAENEALKRHREIIARRKLLKREMQACLKAIRCTSKTMRLLQRWRRRYDGETYTELMRIARNPAERKAVAQWIIIEPKRVRQAVKR